MATRKGDKYQLTLHLRPEQFEDLENIQQERFPDLTIQNLINTIISNAARERRWPFNDD